MTEIMPSNFFLHLYMQEVTQKHWLFEEEKNPTKQQISKQTQNLIKLWDFKISPFWSLLIAFFSTLKKETLASSSLEFKSP